MQHLNHTQIEGKCCKCNSKNGRCNNCSCVKNNTACLNCAPGFNNCCNNKGDRVIRHCYSQPEKEEENYEQIKELESRKSQEKLLEIINNYKKSVQKHILKKQRIILAKIFTSLLSSILNDINNTFLWLKLFIFSFHFISKATRGGKKNKQSETQFEEKIKTFADLKPSIATNEPDQRRDGMRHKKLNDEKLVKLICSQVEDRKIRSAVRLLTDDQGLAPDTEETLERLKEKHLKSTFDAAFQSLKMDNSFTFTADDVTTAINSFPAGSSDGIDSMTPQHLKELFLFPDECEEKTKNLEILTKFINVVASAGVPPNFRSIFFSARLIALNKKDGGVRPIAVSSTLRRLTSKLVAMVGTSKLKDSLTNQFGIGVRSGCEVAVHLTRQFFDDKRCNTILKIDYKNAFNSLHRHQIINTVAKNLPLAYNYTSSSYRDRSFLCYKNSIVSSEEGIQQGDPLGPLLFCASIQPIISSVKSELNCWYMDDGTIGGNFQTVKDDLEMIKSKSADMGLLLNESKCEVLNGGNSKDFKNMKQLNDSNFMLLGSPITTTALNRTLTEAKEEIERCLQRVKILPMHYAYKIIQASFGAPRLISILRTAPCHDKPGLIEIDCVIKDNLEDIFNVRFTGFSNTQATLPINFGSIGIRSANSLSMSAFIASFDAATSLRPDLLPTNIYDDYKLK